MISKQDITGALDSCGIPWAEPSFAPRKPPEPPYALVLDTYEYDGSDMHIGMIGHDTRILLHDIGDSSGRATRYALAVALASANVHFTQYPADYNYDLKLYQSEYEIDETYYEKWSE